jgi:hypothetical protein
MLKKIAWLVLYFGWVFLMVIPNDYWRLAVLICIAPCWCVVVLVYTIPQNRR